MNAAYIYGKSVEEDCLTSDIFGLLRYVPPQVVLWPFLKRAEPFSSIGGSTIPGELEGFEPESVAYWFWPAAGERQPDLLLLIRNPSGRSAAIVIEIKHSSGKHNLESNGASIGPPETTLESGMSSVVSTYKAGDQLADYFVALLDNQIRLRAGRASSVRSAAELEKVVRQHQAILVSVPQHAKFLLYVTADDSMPREEVEQTRNAIRASRHAEAKTRLYWVGWRMLYEAIDYVLADKRGLELPCRELLEDVLRLLELRDLRPFAGWKQFEALDLHTVGEGSLAFYRRRWFQDLEVANLDSIKWFSPTEVIR